MLKVLIIEDELEILDILSEFFSDQGFDVLKASNGVDGIELFNQENPQLVFTDLKMPHMDGFGVIDTISAQAPQVPLIVVSGNGIIEESIEAIRRGAWDYVAKPILEFDELEEVIERALKRADKLKENIQLVKHLEDEIERRARIIEESNSQHITNLEELQAAKIKAKSADKVKTEFVSNVTHELRTPLSGILGMGSILLESDLNSEQRECAEVILSSGELLLSLINNLLDFSMLDDGQLKANPHDFELAPAVHQICLPFQSHAEKKNLKLTYTLDPQIPQIINTDEKIINQMVTALLDNAIKFTNAGSVSVNVELEKCHNESDNLIFSVSDTGSGIPELEQKKIFELFVQADGTHTRSHGGTGLGLPLCAKLCELMKGSIWLESTLNAGTSVHFSVKTH